MRSIVFDDEVPGVIVEGTKSGLSHLIILVSAGAYDFQLLEMIIQLASPVGQRISRQRA
jgi:hypothetical protein